MSFYGNPHFAGWLCECAVAWTQATGNICWCCGSPGPHKRVALAKEKASPDYAEPYDGDAMMLDEEEMAIYGVYV